MAPSNKAGETARGKHSRGSLQELISTRTETSCRPGSFVGKGRDQSQKAECTAL